MSQAIAPLVSAVLATRNAAHLAHWAETDGYRHEVLGEFYDELLDKIDEIVEVCQADERLKVRSIPFVDGDDIVKHLMNEVAAIERNRAKFSEGIETIGALIDDLCKLYRHTAAKLMRFGGAKAVAPSAASVRGIMP
jgi:hypothetical protein